MRTLWQNKERILSEVRCVESELCTHCWRTHYILSKSLYSPGTLVVQASGEHTGMTVLYLVRQGKSSTKSSAKLLPASSPEVAVGQEFARGPSSCRLCRCIIA